MDLIKKAEQEIVKTCRAYEEMFRVLESLERFGNRACKAHVGKQAFFQGLSLMKDAVRAEHSNAIGNLFMLAGVGGDDALQYSREKFEEWFGKDNTHILSFLEEWGDIPSWYKDEDEKEFRKQCKEKIKEMKNGKP